MDISTVRPKVAQLSFQLLGRSVHPELFHIYKSHSIQRENFSVHVDITSDGHCVRWMSGKTTLTEIASSSHQLTPSGSTILCVPLRHKGGDSLEVRPGVSYKYAYELQRVPAEMFWSMQQQLGDASKEHELIQFFDASGRIAIGGLSFVNLDTRLNSLHIRAIHTFPDDLALVKTESTFKLLD